jgi:DeoR family glycerol-3-phosphate regulon repressor
MAERVAADSEGATVSLGVGSTIEQVAQALIHHQSPKILTNNLRVLRAAEPHIDVIVGRTVRIKERSRPEVNAFLQPRSLPHHQYW